MEKLQQQLLWAEERALKAEEHADSLLEELTEAKERVLQLERGLRTDGTSQVAQLSTAGADKTTTSPSPSVQGQRPGIQGQREPVRIVTAEKTQKVLKSAKIRKK
uniref:uncharacterized protein isoform X3 n=1 Tax=Myxine glutinosa TaxID=7769 RepID=UPI00358FF60B